MFFEFRFPYFAFKVASATPYLSHLWTNLAETSVMVISPAKSARISPGDEDDEDPTFGGKIWKLRFKIWGLHLYMQLWKCDQLTSILTVLPVPLRACTASSCVAPERSLPSTLMMASPTFRAPFVPSAAIPWNVEDNIPKCCVKLCEWVRFPELIKWSINSPMHVQLFMHYRVVQLRPTGRRTQFVVIKSKFWPMQILPTVCFCNLWELLIPLGFISDCSCHPACAIRISF